jgi:hypothetical protein
MDMFCDSDAYKLDYKIFQSGKLIIYIQCGILSTSFTINNPQKLGIDKWQQLRDSKTGRPRYDGARIEQKGYNINILFEEDYKIGYYQYIKSIDGMLEMGIIYGYNKEGQKYLSVIKIPIEYCYDMLDRIITDFTDNEKLL